jgi:hypothetical protein
MSTLVRSVLGVALLVTGASAAMAQSANQPVAAKPAKAASNNAPVANQTVQTGTSTATTASNNAPAAQKPRPAIADKSDPYGGNDPNSTAGARAFFTPPY